MGKDLSGPNQQQQTGQQIPTNPSQWTGHGPRWNAAPHGLGRDRCHRERSLTGSLYPPVRDMPNPVSRVGDLSVDPSQCSRHIPRRCLLRSQKEDTWVIVE